MGVKVDKCVIAKCIVHFNSHLLNLCFFVRLLWLFEFFCVFLHSILVEKNVCVLLIINTKLLWRMTF